MMDNKLMALVVAIATASSAAAHEEAGVGGALSVPMEGVAVADTSGVIDLDEVVVVAQPKESVRLRRQPMGSTVFTDRELQRLSVRSLARLSYYVPSFVVPDYGARYTSSMYVRGIGSRIGDPSVGLYFDNIPLVNKSTYNRHVYMLDRIDVLRGPQGTLYGINTEGGLVRMYSKNPLNYQGTDLNASIGTGMRSNVEVAHYHRPSERFAFSAAAFYTGLGGFFDNTATGSKADRSTEFGGRMRFVLTATPRLMFDLTADYQYVNQNAFAYGEHDAEKRTFADPSTTFDNGYRRQMFGAGLSISYKTDALLLSSATGYQFLDDHMQMDQDYLPADYMRLEQKQLMNAVTQELTLRSLRPGPWQHTTGAFFSHQWLRTEAPVSFGDAMNSQIVANMGMPPSVAQMLTLSDNWVSGLFHTPQLNVGVYHESNIDIARRVRLTIGLRYDHQHVSIDYDTRSLFTLGMSMPQMGAVESTYSSALNSHVAESYHQLLPKLGVTWGIGSSGSNVYAVVSKGFRAGGYNLQMFSDIFRSEQSSLGMQLMQLMQGDMEVAHDADDYANINRTITYEPEVSWNYELGTHLNLFDGHLHADASVYYMRVSNQQLSVMAGNYGYGRMMINAGRSGNYGAELALRGTAFADHLAWAATYSYNHATFRSYSDSVSVTTADGTSTERRDYRGKRVPFVPRHTFSVMADYRFDILRRGWLRSVTIGADVAGNGDTYWDVDNTLRQPFYALLGAHIGLDLGTVKLNIWGRNLTDTRYGTFLVRSSVDGVDRSFAQRGAPLQLGVDASVHF